MRLENYENEKPEYGRPPYSQQVHPWLVICHGDDMQKQTFFSISEDRYYVRTIPELGYIKILARVHEWLVLLDYDSEDCYIWNPITMDKFQLPPLPKEDIEYNKMECLLSTSPHDPECCILFLDEGPCTPAQDPVDQVELSSLYFCKPGHDQEFHKQDLQFMGDNNLMCWTVFEGNFYALTLKRQILVVLDLNHDLRIIQVTPLTNQRLNLMDRNLLDMPFSRTYLVQSYDNDLLCVHKTFFGITQHEEVYGFQVFRFDVVKKLWVRVKSIGETAIFIDNSWGITCSTRGTNLQKESIYFIERGDRCLYIFNLKTKSMSVSLPCPHVSRRYSSFYWLTLPPAIDVPPIEHA